MKFGKYFVSLLAFLALASCGVNIAGRFYPGDTKALHYRVPEFTSIPANLNKLPGLEALSVSYSEVSRITGLEGLSNLTELNLDHNHIARVQGLNDLPSLESLDLSYNEISKIENLENLTSIIALDLSHNQIESLENLRMLKSLKTLKIVANPIRFISLNTYRLIVSNDVKLIVYEGSNATDVKEWIKKNDIRFKGIDATNASLTNGIR